MRVGASGLAMARCAGGGNGRSTAARISPSSSSSDEVALPMKFVSGGAYRHVGRVSDDDFEASSWEETSDSSFSDDNEEEFVPLAFGYINGNPRRHIGTPARTQDPTNASEQADSQSSFSDCLPLEVCYERRRAKRNCGTGAHEKEEDKITTSLSSLDDDDTSAPSDALPVEFEWKKRTRGVGNVHNPTYKVSDSESAISLSEEDEAPLNAQLIYTLVKRLRNPYDEVTLEAFDYLDFDDTNFKEVLGPLKQIKACLERRASYPMKQNKEVERKIAAAVQSLPSEEAIAAKVMTVKSRQIRPAQPTPRLYRGGENGQQNAEILQGLVARLKNPKDNVELSEFEKLDWTDGNFEPVLLPLRQILAYMEAKEVMKAKPAEGAMKSATALDDKIKTAILSLPADKEMAAKIKTVASRPMSREPANGEAIRDLIKQLRDPERHVPASAFEKLDWNDEQFSRELEPLMKIRAFLEAKECSQQKAGEKVMGSTKALDDRIRTAIMSLPAEKEMSAKVQAVRSRQLKATNGQNGVHLGGELSPAEASKAKTAVFSAPSVKAKDPTVRAVQSCPISGATANGEGILNLIKRLKESDAQVPLSAFDALEWNDRNFMRELEPLQQIRVYMEAKEVRRKAPGEKNIAAASDLDKKIKTAILALPPEKVVAVKLEMLKERNMSSDANGANPQAVRVGQLSAPAGAVQKMKDSVLIAEQVKKKKAKEGKLSASTSQVMQVGAKVISSHHCKYKAKESNMLSEPTRKTRRPRNTANRSVSFLNVEEPTPDEIVDEDQVLAEASGPQHLQDGASTSPTTAAQHSAAPVPARQKKSVERRQRNHRAGNSAVSFSDVNQVEADTIHEDDERLTATKKKRRLQRRRAAHHPGRSLSISSLPDLEADEVREEPTLPARPAAREAVAAATTVPAKSGVKPSGAAKKRRVRIHNNNNRSCSFSDVAMEEAGEVPDASAETLKNTAEEAATTRVGKGVTPPKVTHKLVRRRKLGEEGGTPAAEKRSPEPEKEGESSSFKKGRRTNVSRPRGTNASMIEDNASGEIEELLDESQRVYSPSSKQSSPPEKAFIGRAEVQELPSTVRTHKKGKTSNAMSAAVRKRRQRLHASKELSISAIPEDVPGEIVEDEHEICTNTTVGASLHSTLHRALQSSGANGTFPMLGSGSRKGSMRSADRQGPFVRSSVDGCNKVALPPNAQPSAMPDVVDTLHLPPPKPLRRSAEPRPNAAKSPVKTANGAAHISPLRSSR